MKVALSRGHEHSVHAFNLPNQGLHNLPQFAPAIPGPAEHARYLVEVALLGRAARFRGWAMANLAT